MRMPKVQEIFTTAAIVQSYEQYWKMFLQLYLPYAGEGGEKLLGETFKSKIRKKKRSKEEK